MILKYMSLDLATFHSVMVQVWVGKDFPDMRQNEREIKFIRVGAEKAMAPHSSTLAWKIPRWRSLVGCSPWGR